MSTAATAATAATTATVVKDGDKFTCTLGTTVLGKSKHADYFEFHLKKGDVKVLRDAGITHIDYVDGGTVNKTFVFAKPAAKAAAKAAKAALAAAGVTATLTAALADATVAT